jgi:hypothetical protein
MQKINQNDYSNKVAECLECVNFEINKLNLQHKSANYHHKMITIVINDQCAKFKLKPKNIKTIFFSKFYK